MCATKLITVHKNKAILPGPKKMITFGICDEQWRLECFDKEGNKMRTYADGQTRVSSDVANKLSWFDYTGWIIEFELATR
jgi:hypothetical protein